MFDVSHDTFLGSHAFPCILSSFLFAHFFFSHSHYSSFFFSFFFFFSYLSFCLFFSSYRSSR